MDTGKPSPEPSEEELRSVLESREKAQEGDRRVKNRRLTRILLGTGLVLAVLFVSSGSNRQALVSLFQEPPPPSATPPPAPAPESQPMLEGPKERGGDPGVDLQLAKDILNFMRVPKSEPATPPGSPAGAGK